jgi:hypothetical protein
MHKYEVVYQEGKEFYHWFNYAEDVLRTVNKFNLLHPQARIVIVKEVWQGKTGDVLLPEQQVSNLIHSLVQWTNAPRRQDRMWNIRTTADQLDNLWSRYCDGKLEPEADNGMP